MTTIRATCPGVVLLAAVAAGGCAAGRSPDSSAEVRRLVRDRTGADVEWRRDAAAEESVRSRLHEILARPLSADSAVAVALLNNRNLRATYEDLGVARAELVQAGLLRNPVFSADIRFDTAGGGTGVEMALVQDLVELLQLPLRRRLAQAEVERAKLRVAGEAVDLARDARAAVYCLQAATQLLEVRRTVLAAEEASYEFMRRLRDAGNVAELDVSSEQATYEQAKLDVASAEAAALEAREAVNRLLGLWGPDTQWSIEGRLPELPETEVAFEQVEGRAVGRSLDLAEARGQLQSAADRLGLSRAFGALPELELGASAERDAGGGWGVGPAVAVPVPLFDQGQARTAAARAELRRRADRYYALAVEVRSAARSSRDRLRAARQRAAQLRDVILPLRQRVVEQTQLRFNAMQVSAFELLSAKQQQVEAGAAYVEALRDYWLARADLEQVLNGRLARPESTGGK